MCDHIIIADVGQRVCCLCGQIFGTEFVHAICSRSILKRPYNRATRFKRLILNLRGFSNIPFEIMELVKHAKTLDDIRKELRTNKQGRFLHHLPSIWRSLGHEFEGIQPSEVTRALVMFNNISEKISFMYLLTIILHKISRHDLCQFLKEPSPGMKKKYAHLKL